ncbi:nitroreductase family protein [Bacteroidota bacterium]
MQENLYTCLKKVCGRRKSRRVFLDKLVPDDILSKIKEVALTAPYASGKSNWDMSIITDKNKLKQIALSVKRKNEELIKLMREDFRDGYNQYAVNFTLFENAPAVFFLNYRTPASLSMMFEKQKLEEVYYKIGEWERDNYVKSISCVAMLIILAAESLGLGACYMTGPLLAEDEIIDILKVKKDRRIGSVIPVGYYE